VGLPRPYLFNIILWYNSNPRATYGPILSFCDSSTFKQKSNWVTESLWVVCGRQGEINLCAAVPAFVGFQATRYHDVRLLQHWCCRVVSYKLTVRTYVCPTNFNAVPMCLTLLHDTYHLGAVRSKVTTRLLDTRKGLQGAQFAALLLLFQCYSFQSLVLDMWCLTVLSWNTQLLININTYIDVTHGKPLLNSSVNATRFGITDNHQEIKYII